MTEINKDEIVKLFENYRYSFLKETKGVLVFEYVSGMFSGVEMVPIIEKVNKAILEELKKEYSNSGYATHAYERCDIEQIQKDLFNGFFQTKLSNGRIKNKYKQYCERVMNQYGKHSEDYQYIEVSYDVEEYIGKEVKFSQSKSDDHLVDSIVSLMQKNGSQLIVIEAPAGFGKTSTTYEVLSRFQNVSCDVRPFMMELYKDRTASIFKYILLNNIDTDFDVSIKSEIVIENIKAGRIPLLVDGFDELLSKDMDNGMHHAEFKEVESMLSTIADLLQGNAKIMLTSRKTAIFSGEEFVEWYDRLLEKGLDFQVVKYTLNSPSIKDWIKRDDLVKYDRNLLKALNNPVLLGFIKYCGDELSDIGNGIVEKFFDLLLNREITRQDLPFTVEEQKTIMRRLAMVFAGFNCSTDTRSSVMSIINETSSKLIGSKVSVSRDLDGLLNSLTNHALLNRKNDKIGFLNDFIYGMMLADAFLHYHIEDNYEIEFASNIQSEFLDKCINASVYFMPAFKNKVWCSLKKNASLSKEENALCDWKLTGVLKDAIEGLSFDDERLSECYIGSENASVSNCTFSNIAFSGCKFDFNYLVDCTFVNCSFEDCIKEGENLTCNEYGCTDTDGILRLLEIEEVTIPDVSSDEDIKESILLKYFMVGQQRRRMKLISVIRKDYISNEKQFKRCLDSLASDKFLIINGDKSFITNDGIQWLQTKN